MKIMKLISMTDFVENLRDEMTSRGELNFKETVKYLDKVFNYSEFLKQPLTLGMFVPVDPSGKILDKPEWKNNTGGTVNFEHENWFYNNANENVLFKGFAYQFNIDKNEKKWEYVKNEFPHVFSLDQLQKNTVESLLTRFREEFLIELTESAIKKIT